MTIPTSAACAHHARGIAPPGRTGTLHAFADALTDGQVKDLAAYIREFGRAAAWTDVDEASEENSRGEEMIGSM
jgi:cytochrome c553